MECVLKMHVQVIQMEPMFISDVMRDDDGDGDGDADGDGC